MQVIQVKATVNKEMFYNEVTMFGVYSFKPISNDQPIETLNKEWNTFVVTGNCQKLFKGKDYNFTIKPTTNKKYGKGYEFVEFEQAKLDTVEAQQDYLREVVAKSRAEALIKAYPGEMILDKIVNNEIDLSKVKGVAEKTFSKIQDQVNASYGLAQSIVELKDLNVNPMQMKKLINHFGSQDMLIQKVKSNIYCLTEVSGFGFSKVDKYSMNRGDNPEAPERIKACIEFILTDEGNKEGHTWLDYKTLKDKCIEMLNIDVRLIHDVLLDSQKGTYQTLHSDGALIALTKYLNFERKIVSELERINNSFNKKRTYDLKSIESKLGISFTGEQANAVELSTDNGVMLLTGKAGAGKTYTVMGIKESFNTDSYISCALSGQAVKVLSSRGIDSATMHSLIAEYKGTGLPYDVVIIDEMSMVSIELFLQILLLIEDGTQLILVGDDGQLPPIGVGAPFSDLIKSGKYAIQHLTQVHRQAEKSGILTYANKVRDGEQINGYMDFKTKKLGEIQDFTLFPIQEKENIIPLIVNICKSSYKHYGESFIDNFIVLAPKVATVELLNSELRKIFNAGNIKNSKPLFNFFLGDKVIHKGNNKNATQYDSMIDYELTPEASSTVKVYNGSIGTIVNIDIDNELLFVDFNEVDGIVVLDKEESMRLLLAYAITIASSQGIGVDNVLLTFDISAYTLLCKQLAYTGMTRAKKTLVMVVENKALYSAIKVDKSNNRQTFLGELLTTEE